MSTAPVGGSRARLASWVSPYLPGAEQERVARETAGRSCGPRRRRCRPFRRQSPTIGACSASQRAQLHRDTPGVCEPVSLAFKNAACSPARLSQPLRNSSQPPSGSGPCSRCHSSTCVDLQQEVGVLRALGALVDHHRRRDELPRRHLGDVEPVRAGDPVHRRVEVRADVLAGGDVVPVPGGTALVVAADLVQREALGVGERRRQLQDRRALRQRRRQVDDVNLRAGDARDKIGQDAA